jgi:hypothetical protein
MNDVIEFFKRAKRCLRPFHAPGELLTVYFERVRVSDPKKWSFVQMLCQMVRDVIDATIANVSRLYLQHHNQLLFAKELLPFTREGAECAVFSLMTDIEESTPETNRWQELVFVRIFVPIPDLETGGCARNDSTIAPAI